ncbi:7499_t:CDS:2, partial [Scutellospora calospora]
FAAISFIETMNGNTSLTGIATLRSKHNEFVRYKYKAFTSADNKHIINKIEKNTIILIIRRFILENSELNVTILQAISLELKTIETNLSIYDLLTCPPFGNYSAPCKFLNINEGGPSYFTLEHRSYNLLTSNYLISEVTCSYNAGNSRHSEVAKAIESKAVISVYGELYKGNNMMQILISDIE